MDEPEFDRDGYPTSWTVQAVEAWEVRTPADAIVCMDFVGRAWKWPDWGWEKTTGWRPDDESTFWPYTRYRMSTGGWSGNEDLILALERNRMVQMLGWYSSRRGGHYEYRFTEEQSGQASPFAIAAAGS